MFFSSPLLTLSQLEIVSLAEYPLNWLSLTILRISLVSVVEILLKASIFNTVNALIYILYFCSLGILSVNLSFKQCIPSITNISSGANLTLFPLYTLVPLWKSNSGISTSSPFNNAIRCLLNKSISIASIDSKSYSPFSFLGVSGLSTK